MSNREKALEQIAINYLAETEELLFGEALTLWCNIKAEAADRGHFGDCTGEPQTCQLCLKEKLLAYAERQLAIPELAVVAADQGLVNMPCNSRLNELFLMVWKEMVKEGWRKLELPKEVGK